MSIGEKITGVDVEIEDLLNVQSRLSGFSLRQLRRQNVFSNGSRQTRRRGRGMEYEESRAYVVGDDIKTMDWRVMARTGEAHTKVFAEEKERSLMIAIDLSSSMFYGTRFAFKSWAAAQVAAHIGWLASFDGDRLGALVVSPDDHYPVKPLKTRSGLMTLFHQLAQASRQTLPLAPSHSRLNTLLAELRHSVIPGSTIVLISDFLGIDQNTAEILRSLGKHQDMVAFWVHDCSEVEVWQPGPYPVAQQSQNMILDTRDQVASDWLSTQQQNNHNRITALMAEFNISLHPVSCNQDVTLQLAACLK